MEHQSYLQKCGGTTIKNEEAPERQSDRDRRRRSKCPVLNNFVASALIGFAIRLPSLNKLKELVFLIMANATNISNSL
jgi:hypothetical protein